MRNLLLSLFLGMSLGVAGADTRIQFNRGSYGKTIHSSVVRGNVENFWIRAGRGQTMSVWIESNEDNAVFRVVGDGGSLSPDEQVNWNGRLPINGDYLIEVAPTRGNATFDLTVEIH